MGRYTNHFKQQCYVLLILYYTSLTKKTHWSIAGTLYALFVGHTLKTHLKEDVVLSKNNIGVRHFVEPRRSNIYITKIKG